MNIEKIIEDYDSLRAVCYKAIRDEPSLLGSSEWLRYAIDERDIALAYTFDGIQCWGYAYTAQTMSNEHFEFTIPFEVIHVSL